MALSPQECSKVRKRLEDAENQLHLLLTGQAAKVFVDQNGERIEYATANVSRLQAYIQSLKVQLGEAKNTGPMRVWF